MHNRHYPANRMNLGIRAKPTRQQNFPGFRMITKTARTSVLEFTATAP